MQINPLLTLLLMVFLSNLDVSFGCAGFFSDPSIQFNTASLKSAPNTPKYIREGNKVYKVVEVVEGFDDKASMELTNDEITAEKSLEDRLNALLTVDSAGYYANSDHHVSSSKQAKILHEKSSNKAVHQKTAVGGPDLGPSVKKSFDSSSSASDETENEPTSSTTEPEQEETTTEPTEDEETIGTTSSTTAIAADEPSTTITPRRTVWLNDGEEPTPMNIDGRHGGQWHGQVPGCTPGEDGCAPPIIQQPQLKAHESSVTAQTVVVSAGDGDLSAVDGMPVESEFFGDDFDVDLEMEQLEYDICMTAACNFEHKSLCTYKDGGAIPDSLAIPFVVKTGRYRNRLTGILGGARESESYAATYLTPKTFGQLRSAIFIEPLYRDVTFRVSYYDATSGMTFKACCDDDTFCTFSSKDIDQPPERKWRQADFICPIGTSRLLFRCESHSDKLQGACGIDHITVVDVMGEDACTGSEYLVRNRRRN